LLGKPQKGVQYLIASTCHPKFFDHLEGFDVALWHVFANEEDVQRLLPPGDWAIVGGSSVGLRALTIARFLGFVNFEIFGMDGCDGKSGKHAAAHPNQAKISLPLDYDGVRYYTTPNFLECAKETPQELDNLPGVKAKFHGEGLVQHLMRNHKPNPAKGPVSIGVSKPELISSGYRELNARLHRENPEYGLYGGRNAVLVLKLAQTIRARSILDYGSGKGGLAREIPFPLWEYDPAIPGKDESPRPADIVVCFPSGTVVGGSNMFIDQIGVGDAVGGSGGTEQAVTKTFHNLYSGEMVTIKVATVPDLEMTAKHPVLVSRLRRVHLRNNFSYEKSAYNYIVKETHWKPAKDVQKGDWVSVPRLVGERVPVLLFQAHGNSKRTVKKVVDEEAAWLIGLYVAEGFTVYPKGCGGKLTLTLGSHENELASRAVAAFARLGIKASIDRSSVQRSVLRVNASRIGLCKTMDDWCGKGAANKIVPEAIEFAPEAIIRAFITGLVDGDGCLRQSPLPNGRKGTYGYYSVTTISRRLAYGLLGLLHKLGVQA
jgi:hypothetical protein